MILSVTYDTSNSPGEYAALITMTASGWEDVLRQKSLQLIEHLTPTTHASAPTANAPTNPTFDNKYIVIQCTTFRAEYTSGLGVSSFQWCDISSLGEVTETPIRIKNCSSGLFWGNLVYPDLQPISELISKLASMIWPTQVEKTSIMAYHAVVPKRTMDENLSAEDREARERGLALAAHIEHLYRTDEGFRRWYHEGIDEIEAGNFVTFSEDGWKEE